jgi:hypothetical protein
VLGINIEPIEKRVSLASEACFEFLCTITVAAGPRFLTVQVATISTSVCILHAQEVEILLPIRPLLGQWLAAETDFHPRMGPKRAKRTQGEFRTGD